jgi:hypothetical protein
MFGQAADRRVYVRFDNDDRLLRGAAFAYFIELL